MAKLLISSAAGAMLSLAAQPAFAGADPVVICGSHEMLVESLIAKYQQRQDSLGLTSGGEVLEVFVSAEGTWTILVTTPEGMSCILADGEAWESASPSPAV